MHVSTIGIFAHANAGKTTLTEGLLYHCGIISSLGRVDYGPTVTDDLVVEQERGITVRSSYVSFNLNNRRIQLLDTPGHIDFSSEVERAISVLDGAIVVISGVDGIQPQTMAIYKMLQDNNVPIIFFINKLDRTGASINNTLESIKKFLTPNIFLVNRYDLENNKIIKENDKNVWVDLLSTIDEDITAKFLNNEEISDLDINVKLQNASQNGQLYPVLTGVALRDVGIKELINDMLSFFPEYEVPKDSKVNEDFSAIVYSVKYDDNKWQTFVKVLSGNLKLNQIISYKEENIKIKQLVKIEGKKFVDIQIANAGELVVLPSIYLPVGTVIGNKSTKNLVLNYVTPLFTVDIKALDMKNLSDALEILNKEDPYLHLFYNAFLRTFSIDLIGELQGEIILRHLKDRFKIIDATLSETSIIYKETPENFAKGMASYKSCSVIEIGIEPLKRGEGLRFISECPTDLLALKYQKQAERLLMSYYSEFALNGWSLTDAKISITSGKCDSIDSLPLHYNIAVPIAFFRALSLAKTKLLEPQMFFELVCDYQKIPLVIKELSKHYIAPDINTKSQQAYISGTSPLSISKNFPQVFMQLLGGAFSFYQYEIGYMDAQDSIHKIRQVPYVHPLQTEQFVSSQKGSMTQLDKGLICSSGKPKTPRRNNSIKKREAMLIRKGLLPKYHLKVKE